MNSLFRIAPAVAVLSFPTAVSALAQQGPTSAFATSMSYHESSRPAGVDDELYISPPTDPQHQAGPPQHFNPGTYPLVPDYSITKIFEDISDLIEIVEFDAICSGNAEMPDLDANGWPIIANERWMSITVGVDEFAWGLPNSFVRNRWTTGTGRLDSGADLFTYYAQDSTGLASNLPGNAFISQTAEDLGVGGTSTVDFDGFDFGIGVLSESQNSRAAMLFPHTDFFYFSVTQDSADDINAHTNSRFGEFDPGGGQPTVLVPADPGVVYEVEWDETNGEWMLPPRVYRELSDLGLAEGDNVDALAIDRRNGAVVFSTQPRSGWSQLRVAWTDAAGVNRVADFMDTANQTRVTTALGLRDPLTFTASSEVDNVDATCVIEPEKDWRGHYGAIPRTLFLGPANPVDLTYSVTRYTPVFGGDERMVMRATVADHIAATGGFVEFWFAKDCYDTGMPNGCDNWVSFPALPLYPGESSLSHAFDLPPNYTSGSTIFNAVVWDWNYQNLIATSWLSQIRL